MSFCLAFLFCIKDGESSEVRGYVTGSSNSFLVRGIGTGNGGAPLASLFVSASLRLICNGYLPFGSLKPSVGLAPSSGIPPNVPMMTGS